MFWFKRYLFSIFVYLYPVDYRKKSMPSKSCFLVVVLNLNRSLGCLIPYAGVASYRNLFQVLGPGVEDTTVDTP